jgi:hypothetical protein
MQSDQTISTMRFFPPIAPHATKPRAWFYAITAVLVSLQVKAVMAALVADAILRSALPKLLPDPTQMLLYVEEAEVASPRHLQSRHHSRYRPVLLPGQEDRRRTLGHATPMALVKP